MLWSESSNCKSVKATLHRNGEPARKDLNWLAILDKAISVYRKASLASCKVNELHRRKSSNVYEQCTTASSTGFHDYVCLQCIKLQK